MKYKRLLNLRGLFAKEPLLILGPRQVGKSTWAQEALPGSAAQYNLAEADTYRELSAAPELIRQRLTNATAHLFIFPTVFPTVEGLLFKKR